MRRNHAQATSSVAEQINLTPLIDMVFILLIFFLVTASFTKESGIDVDRPSAQTARREEHASMIIGVNKKGEIFIENQLVQLASVRALVENQKAQNPEGTFIIMADKGALTGTTVDVLDQVKLAGVSKVSIAAADE